MLGNVLTINHNYNPVSERINWGFIDKLKRHCKRYERIKVCHYDPIHDNFWYTTTPEIINEEYRPDLVLAHINYHPGYLDKLIWLIARIKAPVVWIVVDAPFKYGMRAYEKFYRNCKFDLAIMRAHLKRDDRSVWLPYSVDTEVFRPGNGGRFNKVGFAGTVRHVAYEDRRRYLEELKSMKLLRAQPGFRIIDRDYPKFLRSNTMGLTTTEFGNSRAKMYEYMASGCALLTTPFREKYKLFDETCWLEFKDAKDLRKKAARLAEDPYLRDYLSGLALAQIKKRHTDAIRINQFKLTLQEFMKGNPIPEFFRR